MVGYSREDLVSGRVRWTDLTPAEWRDRDERAIAELEATGTAKPYEKEYFRKDGSRVPALVGRAVFEEVGTKVSLSCSTWANKSAPKKPCAEVRPICPRRRD
jgi:PAS domain-containing protein